MQILRLHAEAILRQYSGEIPLSRFLSAYFKQHPILGSKDRKIIAERVFTFYRISRLIGHLNEDEKNLCVDAFMGERLAAKLQKNALKNSQWVEKGQSLDERIEQLLEGGIVVNPTDALKSLPELSDGLDANQYAQYLLQQNAVFIKPNGRLRERLIGALNRAEISFSEENDGLISVAANTKLQEVLKPQWYRIQDASSVATQAYFPDCNPAAVWDTCAGGGGKSLLLHEKYPAAKLYASDNRMHMLENLKQRFKEHGYTLPNCFEWDGENASNLAPTSKFDLILCDVPCSGSGTWARSPESLHFFDPKEFEKLPNKQKAIVQSALKHLNPGGYLVYITCSVFRAENEAVVEEICRNNDLACEAQTLINGIEKRADCLYVAILKKSGK
jgi:16S rRNA (cytosine967-C5)-methyltransferase